VDDQFVRWLVAMQHGAHHRVDEEDPKLGDSYEESADDPRQLPSRQSLIH
jgi:hypothetical protein